MSKLYIHFLNDEQIAALKSAGHHIEEAAITEGQKAVAALKLTSVGATITDTIKILHSQTLTGLQKFEQVVATVMPTVLNFLTGNGFHDLVDNVEGIAREAVQSLFNDVVKEL